MSPIFPLSPVYLHRCSLFVCCQFVLSGLNSVLSRLPFSLTQTWSRTPACPRPALCLPHVYNKSPENCTICLLCLHLGHILSHESKGYLTKKESDVVLHQMTWPQSPNLNLIEMVWDELDRSEGKAANKWPAYVGTPLRLLEKHSRWLPHEAGWENAKSVQSCHQGKGWLLWRISKIYFDFFNTFLFVK